MTGNGIVHINENFSNVSEFINSLFNPDVRSTSLINSAIRDKKFYMFFSDSDSEKILNLWLAAWKKSEGKDFQEIDFQYCPESDYYFLKFLSTYILENDLCMYLPSINYLGPPIDNALPIYELNKEVGYQKKSFKVNNKTDYSVVYEFLTLFLCGAHFVCIQSAKDLPQGTSLTPFYILFKESSLKTKIRRDPGNSHYTSTTNRCGLYYPSIDKDTAPNPSPFILSFLTCPTISNLLHHECDRVTSNIDDYNTFFQLEGWQQLEDLQAVFSRHKRHNADYETHKIFLWNISTFGSCVYSEKRATTIFLAPSTWNPKFNSNTYMAPYVGAESIQGWLNTNTVRSPIL
jgi:hypothetical protein